MPHPNVLKIHPSNYKPAFKRVSKSKRDKLITIFYEGIWTNNNKQIIDEVVSDDLNSKHVSGDAAIQSPSKLEFSSLVDLWHEAFIDITETPLQIVHGRNWSTVLFRFEGKHVGEFMGNSPSNELVSMLGVDFMLFSGGQLQEWKCVEELSSLF